MKAKKRSHNIRGMRQESKRKPPKHKSKVLPLEPSCSLSRCRGYDNIKTDLKRYHVYLCG
jgi:hypothetical protein